MHEKERSRKEKVLGFYVDPSPGEFRLPRGKALELQLILLWVAKGVWIDTVLFRSSSGFWA